MGEPLPLSYNGSRWPVNALVRHAMELQEQGKPVSIITEDQLYA